MNEVHPRRKFLVVRLTAAFALIGLSCVIGMGTRAYADTYVPISGAGSTWSENAMNQWIAAVAQYGERVNYAGTGSSDGRTQFRNGTVDFADSDIPFQAAPTDGSQPEAVPSGTYAYIPITAGGTVFMYNLIIAGQRVTNLRLSGQNIAKIFTGQIKYWNDPAIATDNPQLALPNRPIVPVVRSDGSGSTAQFTAWMISQYSSIWNSYCQQSGRAPTCGETSNYPTVPGMIAQSGDLGVASYIEQGYADGAIGYVNYSYALEAGFPAAKMLNYAGYYTEPTPNNVAVSLLQAQVDTTDVNNPALYLTQKLQNVYTDNDPRAYPLSSYSYMIVPTTIQGQFTAAKGKTLAAFDYYAMCQGQQSSASLGYSPMPVNLVGDSFDQIKKIPGAVVQNITIQQCNNPTFSPDGTNRLATEDPMPPACDKQGPTQCSSGTGGAGKVSTPVSKGNQTGTQTTSPQSSTGSHSGSQNQTQNQTHGQTQGQQSAGGSQSGTAKSGTTGTQGGTSSTNSGASTTPASGGSPTVNGSSSNCDPSTGICGSSGGSSVSSGAQTGQASGDTSPGFAVASTSLTLGAPTGWTGTQSLILLAGLLLIATILAPGVTARYLRRPKP